MSAENPIRSRLELDFNIHLKDYTVYELEFNFDHTVKFMRILSHVIAQNF
jgi:hypothetical protein